MPATQILIIGAGPVGMVSALCLARAGIECVLIDRHTQRLTAPKAHAINPRSLEICERLGLNATHIRSLGASREDGGMVHFMDTLSSTCFGGLPYERQDDAALAHTPWPLVNIPQPVFEQCLEEALSSTPEVTFLRGVTAADIEEQDNQVIARLTGYEHAELSAEYIIAADGAGSRIRDALGIGMTGPEAIQHFMMIHFEADLRPLTQAHPGLLYFCLSPTAGGTFIGYQRDRTWVFMQAYNPATESRADFDEVTCQRLISRAAGVEGLKVSIKNVSPWAMSAQVADAYRADRIFLAGDAAHRFPPTGGLGLNTGIADAENIAWKLASILNQEASTSLLETYETERRPVAQINSQQSLSNSAKMMFLFGAVHGDNPDKAAQHYAAACADPQTLPEIAAAVELQRPHFNSFNLQIGYKYGAVVDVDQLDISKYVPAFEVGDFLPLTPLSDSPWLLGKLSPTCFSLLTGPVGHAWRTDCVTTLVENQDFHPKKPFWQQAQLTDSGALLIRPDGHIAARWDAVPTDPKHALTRAMAQCLGHNS